MQVIRKPSDCSENEPSSTAVCFRLSNGNHVKKINPLQWTLDQCGDADRQKEKQGNFPAVQTAQFKKKSKRGI